MSASSYLLGMTELLVLASALGLSGYVLRSRLLPEWAGSRGRLVEAVLALALLIVLTQGLGTIGLLDEVPLLLGGIGLAAATFAWVPRRAVDPARRTTPSSLAARGLGMAIGLIVVVAWAKATLPHLDEGMWGFDTLWYHMPLAAEFAQTGSITSPHRLDPVALNWFYPANSELLHAVGISILDRDILSPVINVGWLALGLLAAWCLGRPFNAAPASVLGFAAVAVAPVVMARQPGEAGNDMVATALLLSSAAILVNACTDGDRNALRPTRDRLPYLVPSGLAAGLALGTKLNLLAPVAALAVGVALAVRRESRRAVAGAWTLAALAVGGLWFVRNAASAGNPLPWFSLGPLSEPARVARMRPDFSVSHYLGDGRVWDQYFLPGFQTGFGELWFVMLGAVAIVLGGALTSGAIPTLRALALCVAVGLVAYTFTPFSAGGPEGAPVIFSTNLRWTVPFVALALALLPTLPWTRAGPGRWLAGGALAAAFVVNLDGAGLLDGPYLAGAALVAVLVGLLALIVTNRLRSPLPNLERIVYASICVAFAIALYWPQARDYLATRYAGVWPGLNVSRSFLWAKEVSDARIAVGGTTGAFYQYGFYGNDVSNSVTYLGREGPRGSLTPIRSCGEWRRAINEGGFDYVVATPTLNVGNIGRPGFSPEKSWTAPDPATTEILVDGRLSVYRIDGMLDPACADTPDAFSGLPPLLDTVESD